MSGRPAHHVSPGSATGSGMELAIGVAEAGGLDRRADRPRHGVQDVGTEPDGRRRPIEMGRRVEVAGQERRDARGDEGRQDVEPLLEQRQPGVLLELDDVLDGLAIADVIWPVRVGRQMDVRDRDNRAGWISMKTYRPVGPGRVDERQRRDDLDADVDVGPAERLGDPGCCPRPLRARRRRGRLS